MRLRDYLDRRKTEAGETLEAFAVRAEIGERTLYRLLDEHNAESSTLLRVVQATAEQPTADGGTVTLEELLE
jgi:predicted transcriptional regulator